MNAEPQDPEMALLKTAPYRLVTDGIGVTYHGFRQAERGDGHKAQAAHLDEQDNHRLAEDRPIGPRVLGHQARHAGGGGGRELEKWTDAEDGVYLSDHYPVCAVLHPSDEKG